MTRKLLIGPLALVVALAACVENESTNPPTADPNLVSPRFARYVAFGNSITAGFQSGGINDSTQMLAYPALLAGQMGTAFHAPLLNFPGCPPPLLNIFTQTPVASAGPAGCAFRDADIPEYYTNVAIPGAAVLDVYDPLGSGSRSNTLTSIMGGGRSQVENAAASMPTFVTVWIGNNDALGAALNTANPGDPAAVTPPATFTARYTAMMDSIDALGTVQGGVLIGAVQVALAPYFTQGRVWKGFELQYDATLDSAISAATGGAITTLNTLDVGAACLAFSPIPGTSDTAWTLVPFAVGGPMLAAANAKVDSVLGGILSPLAVVPVTMGCGDTQVITNTEVLNLLSAVTQYNATIEAAATARDWIFLDPNDLLEGLAGTPGAILPFPAFPGLPGVTPEMSQNTPFGSALSRDGIHPSTSAHRLVTNALIQAINAKYQTTIPPLN